MARKLDLKDKLDRRGSFAGWEDVVTQADAQVAIADSSPAPVEVPPAEDEIVRKTYLLHQWQVDQIAQQAKRQGIQLNEYMRALLEYVLDEVEEGRVVVSAGTTTVSRAKGSR